MAKAMSPAEYREHAKKKRESEQTVIKTLKSGAVFELRRPDLQAMTLTGRLPQSLLNQALTAWKEQGKVSGESDSIEKMLKVDTVTDALIFMREIVCECTVNPKFVEFATEDNQIGAADMLKEDFMEIFSWATGNEGVENIDGLESFREGRERGTIAGESSGAELGSESESTTEAEQVV